MTGIFVPKPINSRRLYNANCLADADEPPILAQYAPELVGRQGPIAIEIDGRRHQVQPGDVVLLPAHLWANSQFERPAWIRVR